MQLRLHEIHCGFGIGSNDIPQAGVSADVANGIERGYGSAAITANLLAPHVRLVTPQELMWYARLHLRTQQTFGILLDAAQADLDSGSFPTGERAGLQARIAALRNQTESLDYSDAAAREELFHNIQALWTAVRKGPNVPAEALPLSAWPLAVLLLLLIASWVMWRRMAYA